MAKPMRALLTGGRGFVGARLANALRARHPNWLIESPDKTPFAEASEVLDVVDAAAVNEWVRARQPEVVVHLAAVAAVTSATRDPRQAWRVNLCGTLNLVLALQEHAPNAHLMLISSAEVYGRSLDSDHPVTEAALLQPINAYAASKAAADILVRQAAEAGLSATVMRAFNHTGPGQSELFAAPSFAAQIARIEAGLQSPVLKVGSLDEERDFLDVDDVVDAYADALDAREKFRPGETFNVSSGIPIRIGELLDFLLGQSQERIIVQVEADRQRSTPTRRIVGDATRLRHKTSWTPRRDIRDTLTRILLYERNRLSQHSG